MIRVAIMVAGFAYAVMLVNEYLERPYYFESWSERKCAFIELSDGSRVDCSQFDPNAVYIHRWSK